jgi:hypothetical protein
MQRLLNLLSNNNSKPPLSPNNKLKRPKWLSNRQNRLELPKRSKIKSTERMLNSLPCSKLRRKQKHSPKSLEIRQKKKQSLPGNGMLLWLKEQSKKNKIKPLLN